MIKLTYISVDQAREVNAILRSKVKPSENRVLVFSPGDDEVTQSGIIIPGSVKEGKPRKGVVILQGYMDENHTSYNDLTQVGTIITYGLYAGKEVEFDVELPKDDPTLNQLLNSKGKFTILDSTEIIMAEANQ